MKKIILTTLGMGLLAVGFNASAAQESTALALGIELTNSCSISLASATGTFAPKSAGAVASSTLPNSALTINCTTGGYSIGASEGSNVTGSTRNLRSGSNDIAYVLTIDSVEFGDSNLTGGSSAITTIAKAITGATANTDVTYQISGTASVLAASPAGSYSDSVNIIVDF